jgi:hypothetical protein
VSAQSISTVQRYDFDTSYSTATQLSGITYTGGKKFLAITDQAPQFFPLKIDIDRATGGIKSFVIDKPVQLKFKNKSPLPGGDFEGIAFSPARGSLFMTNEHGSEIREFGLGGIQRRGVTPASDPTLTVFNNTVFNQGLESTAWSRRGGFVWTANQNSLTSDGPLSTVSQGETIRLQRFTGNLKTKGQWAYQLDANDSESNFNVLVSNNVSDLLALPNGRLIALERAEGRTPDSVQHMRIRLYEVDFNGATDLKGGALAGATPVGKTLLWESFTTDPNSKFEGLTLGPRLKNGDLSLLLLADNEGGSAQSLFALRVAGANSRVDKSVIALSAAHAPLAERLSAVPEPSSAITMLIGIALLARRRAR